MRKFRNSHDIERRRAIEAEEQQRRATVESWKGRLVGAVVDPVAAARNIERWHQQRKAARLS